MRLLSELDHLKFTDSEIFSESTNLKKSYSERCHCYCLFCSESVNAEMFDYSLLKMIFSETVSDKA